MPQRNDPSDFPGGPVTKNLPANAGDTEDMGSIPGSGRTPGEGNDTLLQYSCLENSMDRGAWWATVHGVTKSWSKLNIYRHTHTHTIPTHRVTRKIKDPVCMTKTQGSQINK